MHLTLMIGTLSPSYRKSVKQKGDGMKFTRRIILKSFSVLAVSPLLIPVAAIAAAPLRIGVIGAGALGAAVGRRWVESGHEVMFSSRHPRELEGLVASLGPRASVGLPAAAADFGEVILLAVPFVALPQIGRELRPFYSGKILLDSTNPWGSSDSVIYREARERGVAQTVAKYITDARLVRAFSCVDASVIETSGKDLRARVGMPLASDDASAIKVAANLVNDAGCDPVVVGDLASATSFQQGGPGWRAHVSAAELRHRLGLPAGA